MATVTYGDIMCYIPQSLCIPPSSTPGEVTPIDQFLAHRWVADVQYGAVARLYASTPVVTAEEAWEE